MTAPSPGLIDALAQRLAAPDRIAAGHGLLWSCVYHRPPAGSVVVKVPRRSPTDNIFLSHWVTN